MDTSRPVSGSSISSSAEGGGSSQTAKRRSSRDRRAAEIATSNKGSEPTGSSPRAPWGAESGGRQWQRQQQQPRPQGASMMALAGGSAHMHGSFAERTSNGLPTHFASRHSSSLSKALPRSSIYPANGGGGPARKPKKPLKKDPFEHLEPFSHSTFDADRVPTVTYVTDLDDAERLLSFLKGPLGLDIEMSPNFIKGGKENPTALIQLADRDRILVLQVSYWSGRLPDLLVSLLADPKVLLLGVGIAQDSKKLARDYPSLPPITGLLDLNDLAPLPPPDPETGRKAPARGLAKLVGEYTGRRLVKSKRYQMSRWGDGNLNEGQLDYAANDAYCAVQVYARLQLMALSPNDWTSVIPSPQLTSSSHDEAFARAILHRPGEGLDRPDVGRWWKLPSGGWFDWVEERVCRKKGGNGRETPAKG